jgi:acetylornithine deacetylase/succinyl-diaminopimelate desuccinylase-like protein
VRAGVDLIELTRSLVDIDSTTGREGEAGRWLAAYLRDLGFHVIEQPVDDHRFNVIATSGVPAHVVLSTHFDCVPPFFPSRVERRRIYGRGACDAKGILAAQVAGRRRAPPQRRAAHRAVVRGWRRTRQRRSENRESRCGRFTLSRGWRAHR